MYTCKCKPHKEVWQSVRAGLLQYRATGAYSGRKASYTNGPSSSTSLLCLYKRIATYADTLPHVLMHRYLYRRFAIYADSLSHVLIHRHMR